MIKTPEQKKKQSCLTDDVLMFDQVQGINGIMQHNFCFLEKQ